MNSPLYLYVSAVQIVLSFSRQSAVLFSKNSIQKRLQMSSSRNENLLQEVSHYGPVTALKFFKHNLLVGYGPVLQLYSIDGNLYAHLWLKRVFKRNKIHSIAVCLESGRVAVCGSRSFAVLDLNGETIVEKAINEWIMAIEFLSEMQLAILNSHNQVIIVKLDFSVESNFVLIESVHCDEKSILYSGSITKTTTGEIYVAAGTVMDGVLVWNLRTSKIVYHLKDHEGSIFAVKIDSEGQYIVSCSDDRSIKAYDFRSGSLLASGWGHGSRIWSLLFGDLSGSRLQIISMGEDCSTRIWEYDGTSTLHCSKLYEHCHEGKHIWSGDADISVTKALVTGGADGKVRLLNTDSAASALLEFTPSSISKASGVTLEAKEYVKQFVRLPLIKSIVLITSLGKVFISQELLGWACINSTNTISDFVLLQSMRSKNSIVVVTKTGRFLVLSFQADSLQPVINEWHESGKTNSKIINALSSTTSEALYILLDSPIKNCPYVVRKIVFANSKVDVLELVLLKPTDCSFTPTSIFCDEDSGLLFVGSRHANFAVYELSHVAEQSPYVVRKICPGDTITSISSVPIKSGASLSKYEKLVVVLLTVRDGIYLYIRFTKENSKLSHEIIHQNKYTKGSVEGGFLYEEQLYLYGFRSSAFYLWNETKQIEVVNETCGGAHRQWEFSTDFSKSSASFFAYINKSSLVIRSWAHRFGVTTLGLLATGTHGREIRSVAVLPLPEPDGSKFLITASEDATIKVGKINSKQEISYTWTMNNHISGLQSVKFANCDYFISSAANEELVLWRITRLDKTQYAVKESARIPVSGDHPDLRVMDFASLEVEDGFFVALVLSNSVVQLFNYNLGDHQFKKIAETTYSQCCLLNVDFMKLALETYLCVGATDGNFTIWDVSACLSLDPFEFSAPVIKQRLHQSAIKSFALIPNSSGWDVLTGGDDNALVHSTISLLSPESTSDRNSKLSFQVRTFVEKAASATITGVVATGKHQAFVTSVDQIVRVWDYQNELTCLAANYTTVADTGCCEFVEFDGSRFAIAAGAGISIFSL